MLYALINLSESMGNVQETIQLPTDMVTHEENLPTSQQMEARALLGDFPDVFMTKLGEPPSLVILQS